MYKLEYLPIAQSDMVDISRYISLELKNKTAAIRLAEKMVASADRLTFAPYINAVYVPIRPLKNEYRKLLVDNFIMFYYVNEEEKLVTIARVIYAKRDYEKILD